MTDVDSSRYPGSPAMRSLLGAELRDEVNRLVPLADVSSHFRGGLPLISQFLTLKMLLYTFLQCMKKREQK